MPAADEHLSIRQRNKLINSMCDWIEITNEYHFDPSLIFFPSSNETFCKLIYSVYSVEIRPDVWNRLAMPQLSYFIAKICRLFLAMCCFFHDLPTKGRICVSCGESLLWMRKLDEVILNTWPLCSMISC